MSSIVVAGNTSGSVTLAAPDIAGTTTLTLPAMSGTVVTNVNGDLYPLKSGTAVASTSGTAIDFTSIPSWVKRITVMFDKVTVNTTSSVIIVQIGSGSVTTSGYVSQAVQGNAGSGVITNGFYGYSSGGNATYSNSGLMTLSLITSNTWVENSIFNYTNVTSIGSIGSGASPTLSGALERVRITTSAGTAAFTGGTINIMYE